MAKKELPFHARVFSALLVVLFAQGSLAQEGRDGDAGAQGKTGSDGSDGDRAEPGAQFPKECSRALGMESGRITKFQLSASSQWDDNHSPRFARLNKKGYSGGSRGGWSVKWPPDANQWLQVDFRVPLKVTAVETQGREDCCDQWVTNYTISYGQNSGNETYYQENGKVKVFPGNQDRNTIVRNVLSPPIVARYLRINPTAWYVTISMRTEFRGCLDVADTCPDDLRDNPTCYMVPPRWQTWNDSRQACEERDGSLAQLDNSGKNQLVHDHFFLDQRYFWIGMYKKSADDNGWKWLDGSALSYKQWMIGEPNNHRDRERCGEYRTNWEGWNDEDCRKSRRSICDIKVKEDYGLSGEREFWKYPGDIIQVQGYYDFCSKEPLTCDDCPRVLCISAGSTSTHITPVVFGKTTECKKTFNASVNVSPIPGVHKIRIYRTSNEYCRDASDAGPGKDVGSVFVQGPPVIRGVLSSFADSETFASVDEQVSLFCDVGGRSRDLNYTWSKDGVILANRSSALIVVRLTSENDFGDYECEASNKAGRGRKTLRIRPRLQQGKTSSSESLKFYYVTAFLTAVVLVLLLVVIRVTVSRRHSNSSHQSEQKEDHLVSDTRPYTRPYTMDKINKENVTAPAEYSEPSCTPVKELNFKSSVYEDLRKGTEQKYHSLDPTTISRRGDVPEKLTTNTQSASENAGPPYEDVERLHDRNYLELIA